MPEEQISQEINPEPQPVIPPVPEIIPKSQGNRLKIVLFSVLGVLVLAGVVFGAYKFGQKQAQPALTPEAIPTPILDPTANWETFTSNFGYSLRLSPDMQVGETGFGYGAPESAEGIRIYSSDSLEPLHAPHMTIIVIPNPQLTLEQAAQDNYYKNINHKGMPATSIESVHENSFLNEKSYEYTLKNKALVTPHEEYISYEGEYRVIWTERNGKLFAIFFTKTPQFNLMLSTFKFLD